MNRSPQQIRNGSQSVRKMVRCWGGVLACLGMGVFPPPTLRGNDVIPLFSPAAMEDVPAPKTPATPTTPVPQTPKTPATPVPHTPVPQTPVSRTPVFKTPQPVVAAESSVQFVIPVKAGLTESHFEAPSNLPGNESRLPDVNDLQRQKELRFRELKRQMEILSQLRPGPDEPTLSEQLPDASALSEDASIRNHSRAPAADSSPKTLHKEDQQEPKDRTKKISEPQHLPTEDHAAEPGSAQMIVEGTIDRFALATSLFGTGQTELCLDVLKHVDVKQLSREDQIWVEYMQASCHRRAGRIDLAQQSYRRILAERDADWIGELARWWLDAMDARKQLQSNVVRLSETLAAWEEEIAKLAKESARVSTDQ